jgi:uncharacterized damage-inducible protein DinB
MSIADLLIPELDQELAVTRRLLERVPDDRPDWKPHPKSFSIAHLAQLVVRLPAWAPMMLDRTELDIAPKQGPQFPGYSNEKTSVLLAEFDRNAAAARAAIAKASDADFEVPWTLLKGGEKIMTETRYRMLRYMVLNHIVHHRAQLSVYLRLVDVPLPQMYGPTADDRS